MPSSKGFRRRKKKDGSKDPVALGDVLDGLFEQSVFSRGVPIATLASQWPEIVGARLANETAPLALAEGILTVGATNGPWGAQARFLHEEIRRRSDEVLGGGSVRSVRIVVRNPS